jgi:tRNA pseudouridine38-40 synthase
MRTVQGDVERALGRLLQQEVTTVGAGRTDAGVHALGQVMGVSGVTVDVDVVELRAALNKMCGPHIAVSAVTRAAAGWHARFSARSRTYSYAVLDGDTPDPWLSSTCLYHPGRLDVDAMNEGAGHLVGARDFRSLGRLVEPGAPTERTLYELRWARKGSIVRLRVRANAFIQQMARSLAGTLITVGEGKRSPEDMIDVLAAGDRAAAGPVAPAHGLCLVAVEYDEGWSSPFDPAE